ncbi:MAG: type I phosphomannose isomerase catalytic subunit [Bacteroidales bacterium]
MNTLYPLKFKPILKERIWGGNLMQVRLQKKFNGLQSVGESWECSGVDGNFSVVENGFLAGNNLQELIGVYMGDLVGERIFSHYGIHFPLLIKFIDARENLSVQVHPDDKLAAERHGSLGKTEMWYIIDAVPGAVIYTGFNRELDRKTFLEFLKNGKLKEILNREEALPGDVFDIPAGRVHATGAGILLAEIQQASDITYRIYDWDRVDAQGKSRDLHINLALDAINFKKPASFKHHPQGPDNVPVKLSANSYFHVSRLTLTTPYERDFHRLDSFMIYMCLDGQVTFYFQGGKENLSTGETILVPASLETVNLVPSPSTTLLEIYHP